VLRTDPELRGKDAPSAVLGRYLDGVIRQDQLGLNRIYVQAKRYGAARSVGRPEIQEFVGALHGAQADRGVFITTSRFTPEAVTYADRVAARIILIDGQALSALMVQHNVGVLSIAPNGADSQADSAGSIPVIRSNVKAQLGSIGTTWAFRNSATRACSLSRQVLLLVRCAADVTRLWQRVEQNRFPRLREVSM
jgi:Restriction endonuclease